MLRFGTVSRADSLVIWINGGALIQRLVRVLPSRAVIYRRDAASHVLIASAPEIMPWPTK